MFPAHFDFLRLALFLLQLVLVSSTTPPASTADLDVVNIKCIEARPDRLLPRHLQDRCVTSRYGGLQPNAGAYGYRSAEHSSLFANRGWPIRFEPNIPRGSTYTSPHFRLLCLERCWSHTTPTTILARQQYSIVSRPLKDTMLVRGYQNRDSWYISVPIPIGKGTLIVPAIEMQFSPESTSWWNREPPRMQYEYVALHPDDRVICPSHAPDFPLAGPFQDEYYSMQRLCATALDGGHPDVNMGGVCSARPDPSSVPRMFFDPSLTPYIDMIPGASTRMTFSYEVRIQLIQFRCLHSCYCASRIREPRPDGELVDVPWMRQTKVSIIPDGVRMVSKDGDKIVTVFLRSDGGSGQQCSLDNTQCHSMDESQISRFLSDSRRSSKHCSTTNNDDQSCSLSDEQTSLKPERILPLSPTCGSKCFGNGDCSENCPRCRVGLPSSEQIGQGLTRLAFYAASWCAPLARPDRGLLPRNGDGNGGVLDAGPCACNITYVSNACCDSPSGLVWESPEMKSGQLQIGDEV